MHALWLVRTKYEGGAAVKQGMIEHYGAEQSRVGRQAPPTSSAFIHISYTHCQQSAEQHTAAYGAIMVDNLPISIFLFLLLLLLSRTEYRTFHTLSAATLCFFLIFFFLFYFSCSVQSKHFSCRCLISFLEHFFLLHCKVQSLSAKFYFFPFIV